MARKSCFSPLPACQIPVTRKLIFESLHFGNVSNEEKIKFKGSFFFPHRNSYRCFLCLLESSWQKDYPQFLVLLMCLLSFSYAIFFWLQLLMSSCGGTRRSLRVYLVVPLPCGFSLSCLNTT